MPRREFHHTRVDLHFTRAPRNARLEPVPPEESAAAGQQPPFPEPHEPELPQPAPGPPAPPMPEPAPGAEPPVLPQPSPGPPAPPLPNPLPPDPTPSPDPAPGEHDRPADPDATLLVRWTNLEAALARTQGASHAHVFETADIPEQLDPRLVLLLPNATQQARAYRLLRHRLLAHADPRVIAVTSAEPGEGKTTCAANLGLALADETLARVLLIDANLRRPALGAK